jgi:hypothetical protein
MDLTVRRFRQITAAIQRRQLIERRQAISLMTWQTRQITSFIAGGYWVDAKKGNPALDAAMRLAFDDIEKAQMEEAEAKSGKGGNLIWGKDEKGEETVLEIVPDLSSIRSDMDVMAAFGDPTKWKAR